MEPITFKRRGRVRTTPAATIKRIISDCGRYAIEEIVSLFRTTKKKHRPCKRWIAMCRDRMGWRIISEHEKRRRAEMACHEHAVKNGRAA